MSVVAVLKLYKATAGIGEIVEAIELRLESYVVPPTIRRSFLWSIVVITVGASIEPMTNGQRGLLPQSGDG